ncbi:hypothetical protein ACIBCD_15010 [Nocardia brasiliensis]|uniref:hypothetical protein n=1 Tax=Nocardia brasiliensis TaxID=37326 RepID=UPI0037A7E711
MTPARFDVYRQRGVAVTMSLVDALDALDAAVGDAARRDGVLRATTPYPVYAWSLYSDSDLGYNRVTPHDIDDNYAWAQLINARLQRQWPTVDFTLQPPESWPFREWRPDLSWTDGPTRAEVDIFTTEIYHPDRRVSPLFDRRHYSPTAWRILAALAETNPDIEVPRLADGDLDWPAASRTHPHTLGPISICGRVLSTRTPQTITEILHWIAPTVDLTHTTPDTPARITAATHQHTPAQVRFQLTDGSAALIAGYLHLTHNRWLHRDDTLARCRGLAVVPTDPGTDPQRSETAMALIELTDDPHLIDVAADGTVTRRNAGRDADPCPSTHWILHPIEYRPGTANYALTRQPVALSETSFPNTRSHLPRVGACARDHRRGLPVAVHRRIDTTEPTRRPAPFVDPASVRLFPSPRAPIACASPPSPHQSNPRTTHLNPPSHPPLLPSSPAPPPHPIHSYSRKQTSCIQDNDSITTREFGGFDTIEMGPTPGLIPVRGACWRYDRDDS